MRWVKCSDRLPKKEGDYFVIVERPNNIFHKMTDWFNGKKFEKESVMKNGEWLEETPIVFPSEDEIDLFSQETEQGVPRPTDRIIGVEIGAKWALQKIKEQL